jgi:hypothetical protein
LVKHLPQYFRDAYKATTAWYNNIYLIW